MRNYLLHSLAIVLSLGVASATWAHSPQVRRNLLFEAARKGRIEVVAHLTLPASKYLGEKGAAAKFLKPQKQQLASLALQGVGLFVEGKQVYLKGVKSAQKGGEDSPLEVMVLGYLELPASAKSLELRTETKTKGFEVSLLPGTIQLLPDRPAPVQAGRRVFILGPGDRVSLKLQNASSQSKARTP